MIADLSTPLPAPSDCKFSLQYSDLIVEITKLSFFAKMFIFCLLFFRPLFSSVDDSTQNLTSTSEAVPLSSSGRPHIVTPDGTSADLPTDLGDTTEDEEGECNKVI